MNDPKKYELLRLILDYFNPPVLHERQRIVSLLNKVSIYVYNETNTQHSKRHAHIRLSHKYGSYDIGRIWIDDSFDVEVKKDSAIDNKQLKALNKWLNDNKQTLIDAWNKNNNVIEIDF